MNLRSPIPWHHGTRLASGLCVGALLLAACGDDETSEPATVETVDDSTAGPAGTAAPIIDPGDGGDYRPQIDPTGFRTVIDNPYLPLPVGARWVYEGTSAGETERIEVEVTDETRTVMGVDVIVVRDRAYLDGELVEDTLDWFAQDTDGNVWYFGEETAEYEGGEVVSTEGSWEAGVDGALPGIVMPSDPQVGDAYRQEYLAGEAEDMGEIIALGETVSVPAGEYEDVVVTRDWTPLEPAQIENKRYAPGVGLVFESPEGDPEGVGLIEFTPGA